MFGIAELIAFLAETLRLLPGDLVLTGTPSGIGMASTRRASWRRDVGPHRDRAPGAIEHAVA